MDFLSQLALMKGKLLKGGEPDMSSVARAMINDFQRVNIYFIYFFWNEIFYIAMYIFLYILKFIHIKNNVLTKT